ncbi:hypothetical protein CYY_003806 [Polysphondylium violaceum]|uniref:SHSP domain-containing protein n=1 Tax=Polysphondylium violaceum TaxID=133409 RepID=A0A8J4PW91_9MYCE|nr:hypothetical protein CYY_003806 [Polysphondylium violaceum]
MEFLNTLDLLEKLQSGQTHYKKQQQQQQRISTYSTPLNVIETKENVIVEAELVGVPKENISIEIKDNQLIITAEKKQSREFEKEKEMDKEQDKQDIDQPTVEEYDADVNDNSNIKQKEQSKQQHQVKDETIYHCVERKYGIFKRVLDLSRLHSLDISNIKASHTNGVLTITIPKDTKLNSLTINIQ